MVKRKLTGFDERLIRDMNTWLEIHNDELNNSEMGSYLSAMLIVGGEETGDIVIGGKKKK